MSLKRRLTLSLLAIMAIFSLNVLTHFWGSVARTESMTAYRNSVAAQQLTTAIGQQLEEQRTQIRVLATLRETTGDVLSAEDRERASAELASTAEDIVALQAASEPINQPQYRSLQQTSDELLKAWQTFYLHYNDATYTSPFGAADAPALYDEAQRRLELLKEAQGFIAEQRAVLIDHTTTLTDRIAIISFLASILLASILGFFLVRYTSTSLKRLKKGTQRIGSGDLNYRIDNIDDSGELGDLATAFNEMSDKLRKAISEVRAAKENADQANRAKSSFLANVSHELRTPLTAIIGYSEMLHDVVGEDQQIDRRQFQRDLEKIVISGKQLLDLINDILDLSKIETGKMTLLLEDFKALPILRQVSQTLQPMLEKQKNRLTLTHIRDLPDFHNDATKFQQIFLNLLSNATKFTESGHIVVSAEVIGDEHQHVAFKVRDNGIGMSEQQQQVIFDAFVQADSSTSKDYGGTGLGLAICREYCELMGGSIAVESKAGAGSTFYVKLPIRGPAPESGRAAG